MNLTLVVAASTNDVIGHRGALPWHLSEDLQRFRRLTMGKPVIMGRETFESIGRPLDGRRNIVLSRRTDLVIDGCEVVHGPKEALERVAGVDEAMVIGGGSVYRAFLPDCNRIELTRVHLTVEGDTFFPRIDKAAWRVTATESFPAGRERPTGFTCMTLERISAGS